MLHEAILAIWAACCVQLLKNSTIHHSLGDGR